MRQRPSIGTYILLFVIMFIILICATTSTQSGRINPNQINTSTAIIIATNTPTLIVTQTTTPESTPSEINKLRSDLEALRTRIAALSESSDNSSTSINQLDEKVNLIDSRLSGLEKIIVDNPEEALQVVLLEKEINSLSKETNTLQQELDRFSNIYLTLLTIVIAIVTLPYFGRTIREVIDYIQGRNGPGNATDV